MRQFARTQMTRCALNRRLIRAMRAPRREAGPNLMARSEVKGAAILHVAEFMAVVVVVPYVRQEARSAARAQAHLRRQAHLVTKDHAMIAHVRQNRTAKHLAVMHPVVVQKANLIKVAHPKAANVQMPAMPAVGAVEAGRLTLAAAQVLEARAARHHSPKSNIQKSHAKAGKDLVRYDPARTSQALLQNRQHAGN